jgi:WD40 repeat protein
VIILKTRRQKLERVVLSPDGRRLATGGRYGVYLWHLPLNDLKPQQLSSSEISGLGFVSTADWLVFGKTPGDGEVVRLSNESRHDISIRETNVWVATCDGSPYMIFSSYTRERNKLYGCRIGPADAPEVLWEQEFDRGRSQPVLSQDGTWFVQFEFLGWLADEPFQLVFCRPHTGDAIRSAAVGGFPSTIPAVSPDGRMIGYTSGEVLLVRRTDEELAIVGRAAHDNAKHFTGLAFHPSGRYLAATSNDATVKLYDTASWQLATTFTWDIGRMRSVAFSPDGTLGAAGSDTGRIVVWDVDV